MECRHGADFAFARVEGEPAAARLGNRIVDAEQSLHRGLAKAHKKVRLDELRLKNLDNWRVEEIEKSGLMGLWDALAQQAEKLAERLD